MLNPSTINKEIRVNQDDRMPIHLHLKEIRKKTPLGRDYREVMSMRYSEELRFAQQQMRNAG
jgi:hypothetical protein